jgi:hypothetical protein
MNGYFRPRLITPPKELHVLEFDDVEFVPDDEPNFTIPTTSRLKSRAYFHTCPRCTTETKIIGPHPYCTECNWDSLVDQQWSLPCAA